LGLAGAYEKEHFVKQALSPAPETKPSSVTAQLDPKTLLDTQGQPEPSAQLTTTPLDTPRAGSSPPCTRTGLPVHTAGNSLLENTSVNIYLALKASPSI